MTVIDKVDLFFIRIYEGHSKMIEIRQTPIIYELFIEHALNLEYAK